METDPDVEREIGEVMRVVRTGQVGRVMVVDREWGEVFPHKGPMVVLDIDSPRNCYSLCELDLAEPAEPRTPEPKRDFH